MSQNLNYGNWIRKKKLVVLASCMVVTGVLIFLPFGVIYRLLMAATCLVFGISFFFPFYSYLSFSQKGGKFQQKLYMLIIKNLKVKPKSSILDVGCGNGVLAIMLADRFTDSGVTGVDYWGQDWEYSKSVCDQNAAIAVVADRIRFQHGDAARLEFADGSFDGITSNLTFHEVQTVKDKKEVLKGILRLLKPGGAFSFIDYFYDATHYGSENDLRETLQHLGLKEFRLLPLDEALVLPKLLKHPKVLGKVGILCGVK